MMVIDNIDDNNINNVIIMIINYFTAAHTITNSAFIMITRLITVMIRKYTYVNQSHHILSLSSLQ